LIQLYTNSFTAYSPLFFVCHQQAFLAASLQINNV
jgi:hypothetical protein